MKPEYVERMHVLSSKHHANNKLRMKSEPNCDVDSFRRGGDV